MKLSSIPNTITVIRVLLIFPLLYSLLKANYHMAFYLFAFAGLSDGIDGVLARRFNWTSRFGAFIDPLADKLLMIGCFLTLAWIEHIPLYLVSIVVGRDLIILCGVGAAYRVMQDVDFEPTRISKLNTSVQIGLIFLILFELAYRTVPNVLMTFLVMLMILTTVISLVDYVWVWSVKAYQFKQEL